MDTKNARKLLNDSEQEDFKQAYLSVLQAVVFALLKIGEELTHANKLTEAKLERAEIQDLWETD